MQAAAVKDHPEGYRYLAYGPQFTEEEITAHFNNVHHPDPTLVLFAIKDKTRSRQTKEASLVNEGEDTADPESGDLTAENFAGIMALMTASVTNASAEIGNILIFAPFQRTHVTTNAAGLLLAYALNPPEEGGLGLRRMQWQANVDNLPSVACAKRLGFRFEGVQRWQRVMPVWKKDLLKEEMRREDGRGPGRHEAVLSICFDDWEGGAKESVKELMVLRK